MNLERDKYLTEMLGECWSSPYYFVSRAIYGEPRAFGNLGPFIRRDNVFQGTKEECEIFIRANLGYEDQEVKRKKVINNNFSTWTGFGKLWSWAKEQDWWPSFKEISIGVDDEFNIPDGWPIDEEYIDPDKFADALYKFLKERIK